MACSSAINYRWQSSTLDNPFIITDLYYKSGNLIKSSHDSPYAKKINLFTTGNSNFVDYSLSFPNLPTLTPQVFTCAPMDNFVEHLLLNPDVPYRMHKKDIMTLVMYRTHSAFVSALIKTEKSRGKNLIQANEEIENYISTKDYSSLLKLIWSDKENRLDWLRKNCFRLPPPFLFELGIAEFTHAPVIETIQQIVFPIFNAAGLGVICDGACLQSNKELEGIYFAGKVEQLLNGIYLKCLHDVASRYLIPEAKETGFALINLKNLRAPTPTNLEKIFEIAEMIIHKSDYIASPHWLMYHTGRFINAQAQNIEIQITEETVLFPENSWKLVRSDIAGKTIENLKQRY